MMFYLFKWLSVSNRIFILGIFSLAILSLGLSGANAQTLQNRDLIGVWTISDHGIDHSYNAEKILQNCNRMKIIIHADLSLEAIAYSHGKFVYWALSDKPCVNKQGVLACIVSTISADTTLIRSQPLAWALYPVSKQMMDSRNMFGVDSADTLYRCADSLHEASRLSWLKISY